MRLIVQNRNQYEYAFRLLVNDFLRLTEYVEPTDAHLLVYSHRCYELLLRACTEFESLCREALELEGHAPRRGDNIRTFAKIEPKLDLARQRACVLCWRPDRIDVQPFLGWKHATPGLVWYQAYNAVKHHRSREFAQASLGHVRDALAGLFIVLARLAIVESDGRQFNVPGGMWQGMYKFEGLPFGLYYDNDAERVSREQRGMSA